VGQEGFCLSGYAGKFSSEGERRDASFGHFMILEHKKGSLKFLRAVLVVRMSFRKDGSVDVTKVITHPNCTLSLEVGVQLIKASVCLQVITPSN